MLWNDQQIKLINQFLEQESPKLINRKFKGQDINEKVIEAVTRDIQSELRRVFDKRIEIRSELVMPDREFTIYLVQADKFLIKVVTGTI